MHDYHEESSFHGSSSLNETWNFIHSSNPSERLPVVHLVFLIEVIATECQQSHKVRGLWKTEHENGLFDTPECTCRYAVELLDRTLPLLSKSEFKIDNVLDKARLVPAISNHSRLVLSRSSHWFLDLDKTFSDNAILTTFIAKFATQLNNNKCENYGRPHTVLAVADSIKCQRQNVHRTIPTVPKLYKLAAVLGCDIYDLLPDFQELSSKIVDRLIQKGKLEQNVTGEDIKAFVLYTHLTHAREYDQFLNSSAIAAVFSAVESFSSITQLVCTINSTAELIGSVLPQGKIA